MKTSLDSYFVPDTFCLFMFISQRKREGEIFFSEVKERALYEIVKSKFSVVKFLEE